MELKVEKLTKKFNKKIAVDNVSAIFKPGIIGILGANGSGKTTFLRMIVDVLKSDSGEVFYNGSSIQELKENYFIDLGYMPQHLGMYPDFTLQEFLYYMGSLKGLTKAYTKERINILLLDLNLNQERKKKIKQLSGGMKQRLGIAQCLLNDPAIIILDEPTVGLDPKERNHFSQLLATLSKDKIILLSTHIVSDVENIADKIVLMKDGSFLEYNTCESLLTKLEHHVFEEKVTNSEFMELSKTAVICNQKNIKNCILIRYIQEEARPNAIEVTPVLNDVYLQHFQEDSL